jgi:hypothetical protein
MTSSGIEPEIFWLVALCFNALRYRVPPNKEYALWNVMPLDRWQCFGRICCLLHKDVRMASKDITRKPKHTRTHEQNSKLSSVYFDSVPRFQTLRSHITFLLAQNVGDVKGDVLVTVMNMHMWGWSVCLLQAPLYDSRLRVGVQSTRQPAPWVS